MSDVGDYLSQRNARAPPFHAVFLDYCGGVPQRLPHLRSLFEHHVIGDGSLLAVALSYQGVQPGEDACQMAEATLITAAKAAGYTLSSRAVKGTYAGKAPWAPHMMLLQFWVKVEEAGDPSVFATSSTYVNPVGASASWDNI